jgi:hypothetical protein
MHQLIDGKLWLITILGAPTSDLSTFDAADALIYRWQAMAMHYVTHKVWSIINMLTIDAFDFSDYRLIMVAPGIWVRQASLLY